VSHRFRLHQRSSNEAQLRRKAEVFVPDSKEVGHFHRERAALVDSIAREVRSEVRSRRRVERFELSRPGRFEQRTGARVPLAEEKEIAREPLRQHHEIRLHVAVAASDRGAGPLPSANALPHLPRVQSRGVHDFKYFSNQRTIATVDLIRLGRNRSLGRARNDLVAASATMRSSRCSSDRCELVTPAFEGLQPFRCFQRAQEKFRRRRR
jgi:hypothetical protein